MTIYVRDASGNVMSVYEKETATALKQTETHVYGSSRIGLIKERTKAPQTVTLSGGYDDAKVHTFTRGEKIFELSNHLGSVLITVSDKKQGIDANNDGVIDYFEADVVSAQDMYSFGMIMPGRSYSTESYRFGFNGKELDNEVKGKGNSLDFGARIYDPRIARWLSTDPLQAKYPNESPYNFCLNSPIAFKDDDGRDAILITFPDYKIDPEIKIGKWKAPKVGGLGHAGVLIIDNKTGKATYYEYGRYKTTDETKGLVRKYDVGKIVFDKDGKATGESVNAAMGKISQKSGQGGRIQGAYVISDKFKEMKEYAEQKYNESNPGNPQYDKNRPPYTLSGNNCGTFAADVINQDPNVDQPSIYNPSPTNIVSEYIEEGNAEVLYDPKTKKTTIGQGDESDAKKDGGASTNTKKGENKANNKTTNEKSGNSKSKKKKS